MTDIGQLGAINYSIPLNRQQVQQGDSQQQTAGNPDIYMPKLEDDVLAVREKLTDDYFNNYAMLKNFMKEMTDKRIDPSKPDYSQPGGGAAFKLFQRLQGGLLASANKLKSEFELEKQVRPYLYEQKATLADGFDMRKDLLSENPDAVLSQVPTYAIKTANERLGEDTFDLGSQNRLNKNVIGNTEADIDAAVARGEITPQQAAINKAMLQPNVYRNYVDKGGSGSKSEKPTSLPFAEAIINQATGAWQPGTFDEVYVGGKRYLRSTKFADLMGSNQVEIKKPDGSSIIKNETKQIKDWLKDPVTGEITVRFTDPALPPRRVSANEADQFVVELISNNPKYGGTTEIPKLYDAARREGWLTENMTFDPGRIVKNPGLISQGLGETMSDKVLARETERVKAMLNDIDDKMTLAKFGKKGKTSLLFDKDDAGYYLYNATKVLNPATGKPYTEKQTPRFQTQEEVLDFLNDYGYFDLIKQASYNKTGSAQSNPSVTQNEPTQTTQQPQKSAAQKSEKPKTVPISKIKSLVGKPGYEGYSEKELVDYYKANGYEVVARDEVISTPKEKSITKVTPDGKDGLIVEYTDGSREIVYGEQALKLLKAFR